MHDTSAIIDDKINCLNKFLPTRYEFKANVELIQFD